MTQNTNARLNGRQVKMVADAFAGAFTGYHDLEKVVVAALNMPLGWSTPHNCHSKPV
jgi:hypothetical protein